VGTGPPDVPGSINLSPISKKPTQQLVLGHFDDHRASSCPPGKVERCRRNFVVDAILDPDDPHLVPIEQQTRSPAPANIPRGTADWAATVAGISPETRPDRLISVFPVAVSALGVIEPDAQGTRAMSGVETVWLIHFLDIDAAGNPLVRTRIVVDDDPARVSATVYDVTKDGLIRAWMAAAQ